MNMTVRMRYMFVALLVAISPALAANQTMICNNPGGREYIASFDARGRSFYANDTRYRVVAIDNSGGMLVVSGVTVAKGPNFRAYFLPDKRIEYSSNGKLEQVDPCR
jgi:hypothetical protein